MHRCTCAQMRKGKIISVVWKESKSYTIYFFSLCAESSWKFKIYAIVQKPGLKGSLSFPDSQVDPRKWTYFIMCYVVDNRHIFTFLRHMIGWLKWNIKRKNYYIFSWRKFQGKTGSDNTKSLMNLSIIPGYNKNVRFGLPDWKLSQSTT